MLKVLIIRVKFHEISPVYIIYEKVDQGNEVVPSAGILKAHSTMACEKRISLENFHVLVLDMNALFQVAGCKFKVYQPNLLILDHYVFGFDVVVNKPFSMDMFKNLENLAAKTQNLFFRTWISIKVVC